MRLKNFLIVVSDIEKSKKFYKELFGMEVVLDGDENVILTDGLVLQEKSVWEQAIGNEVNAKNNAVELYFEESDIESFVKKLEAHGEPLKYVNPLMELPWGQKVVRFYDLDGHLIEVRTPAVEPR